MRGRSIGCCLFALGPVVLLGSLPGCRAGRKRETSPSAHDYFMAARAAASQEPPISDAEADRRRRLERIAQEGTSFMGGPVEVSCARSAAGLDEPTPAGLTPRETVKKLAVARQQLRLTPDVVESQRGPDAFLADLGLGAPAGAYDAIFRFTPSGAPATHCGAWPAGGPNKSVTFSVPGAVTVELWRGLVLHADATLDVAFQGRPGALEPRASLSSQTRSRGRAIWIRWQIDDAARATADLIIPPRGKPDRTKLEDRSRWRSNFYWRVGSYGNERSRSVVGAVRR